MDINQAARMIEWLDEERRKDKATIATLEERLAQQQDTITVLSKRLNSMESDQTVIRSQVAPNGREGELIAQVRKEMMQLIEIADRTRHVLHDQVVIEHVARALHITPFVQQKILRANPHFVDVLQRIDTHPAFDVHLLTPRLWKQHFAQNPLRSDLDRLRQ